MNTTTNLNLISENIPGYQLLDSGNNKKLEIIGNTLVVRPSPQAIWSPRLSEKEWAKASSVCIRKNDGGGTWQHKNNKEPTGDTIKWNDLTFNLKFTSFGHCGIFFEQEAVWKTLTNEAMALSQKLKRPVKFLNLFGYTGCASLSVAKTGAEVFHVDSSKGVLNWGRDNATDSNLDLKKIKFVQEDVRAFLKHSLRKGFKYDGILADPPSWGHGANKEKWIFEEMIQEMVNDCFNCLQREDSFFFLSCHTHGVQNEAMKNLMLDNPFKKDIQYGELGVIHKNDSRVLPAGIYSMATKIN